MENTVITGVLAAVLAGGAAFYFFRRRARGRGEELPADGSVFRKFGPGVRLRDLFKVGILIEEKGTALYLKMERKAADPETKKLCAWLAGEEEKHRQFIQDQLVKWGPLGTHLTEWPLFLEKVRQEGFFADPPGENAAEEELAAYAIEQEIKTARFYELFEAAFPGTWKRERLERLVREERAHEEKLRAAYPGLGGRGSQA